MKIVIDARMTGSRHGISRYTIQLVRALTEVAPHHRYSILVPPPDGGDPWYADLDVDAVPVKARFVSLAEQFQLPGIVRKISPDLYHSPSFLIPLAADTPTLITLHDLTHLQSTGFAALLYHFYYRVLLRARLDRIPKVITSPLGPLGPRFCRQRR